MTLFDEHGFWGEHTVGWISKIHSDHSDFFDLAADMNKLCQKVLLDLDAHGRNKREIIMASLYIRCLHTFQGLALLAERGMMAQSRILARALIEALFRLCALSKKPELLDVFIEEDKKNRLMFLCKFRKFHGGKLPEDVNQGEIETLEKELEADVEANVIRKPKVEQWAADGELTAWYLTAYPVLSDAVHTAVRDLEEHLKIGKEGDVAEFLWGPDDRGVDEILLTGIDAMNHALDCTLRFFGLQRDEEVKELRIRFGKLASRLSPP